MVVVNDTGDISNTVTGGKTSSIHTKTSPVSSYNEWAGDR